MAKKTVHYYIECACGNKKSFKATLIDNRSFSMECGECNAFIRKIPSFKLDAYMEKEYKIMTMPFGKYKGVVISTMTRSEEISYLIWTREDKLWKTLDYHLRQCISKQIENYSQLKKEGKLPIDNEMREKGFKMPDPLDGMKVPEKKFTSDDLPI